MIDLSSKTVLVVDDEPEIVELMSTILEMAGARVISASNGNEAFEVWKKHPETQLIITDVSMPGPKADGITLVRRIRAESSKSPIILIVTGYSHTTSEEAIVAGANAVFSKPFKMDDLSKELEKCFALKSREKG